MDETFVGGRQRGKGRGPYSTTNKSIVVGAVQRDGRVRLERIPNTKRATLDDFIKRTVTMKPSPSPFPASWPRGPYGHRACTVHNLEMGRLEVPRNQG